MIALRRAPIEDERQRTADLLIDLGGCGAGGMLREIGAGARDRPVHGSDQSFRQRITRPADTNAAGVCRDFQGNLPRCRHDNSQRTGPELLSQRKKELGRISNQISRLIERRNQQRNRPVSGPALDSENLSNGRKIKRIGPKPVERVRWESDDFARKNKLRGILQRKLEIRFFDLKYFSHAALTEAVSKQ